MTRQKDSEQRAGSIYNSADMVEPVVNFQDFIDDNETIVDEVKFQTLLLLGSVTGAPI